MTKSPWELKVIFNTVKICSASDMNWYLLGVEMNLGHAHKTKFWYLLGVFSKFSDEHPVTRGGGNSAYERGGDARRKFWIKPLKETDLGVA